MDLISYHSATFLSTSAYTLLFMRAFLPIHQNVHPRIPKHLGTNTSSHLPSVEHGNLSVSHPVTKSCPSTPSPSREPRLHFFLFLWKVAWVSFSIYKTTLIRSIIPIQNPWAGCTFEFRNLPVLERSYVTNSTYVVRGSML